MNKLKQALKENQLSLPQAPTPVGAYLATIQSGNLLYVSGQLPIKNGTLLYKGQIGKNLTLEEGYAAAELCALNLLSQLEQELDGSKLRRIIKIEGFINCCASFNAHAEVLNGASNLLSKLLAGRAGHIRTVLGCTSLPLDAAIELSAIVEIEPV
jgi:enamine deaminase RidA (YjgF/YER057c/UK114 family)